MAAVASAPTDMVSVTCPHCTLMSQVPSQAWGWLCRKCGSFYTFRLCSHCGHPDQILHSEKEWKCPVCGKGNGGMFSGGKSTSAEIFARSVCPSADHAPGPVLASCATCRSIARLPVYVEQGTCATCGTEYVVRVCAQCEGVVQVPTCAGDWTCTWCRYSNFGSA